MRKVRMRFVERRKLLRISGSYALTIPKTIANRINLKAGDEVLLFLTDDNRIVIAPAEKSEEL